MCGMRALAICIFSAILRRRPTTLTSSIAVLGRKVVATGVLPLAMKASRSSWLMRPAGPVPATWRRSTPASFALRRTAGEASGCSPSGRGAPVMPCAAAAVFFAGSAGAGLGAAGLGDAGGGVSSGCPAAAVAGFASSARGSAAAGSGFPSAGAALPAVSILIRAEPTATVSPISAPSHEIVPSTGEGISTVALSVMTAAMMSSSRTGSPTLTCHSTNSASATPSPTSGILMTCSAMASSLHRCGKRFAEPLRAGEIIPFLRVGIGRVPAGDADHRRFEVPEAVLLHQRGKLGAETGGQRRLMDDDAAAGLLHRGDDGVEVERHEGAQGDDLGVDAGVLGCGCRDIDHGAVGEHGDGQTLAPHLGLAERHGVVTFGRLRHRVLRPCRHRPVVMTVERAVIEPLRLEEDHRVGVLDGRYQ